MMMVAQDDPQALDRKLCSWRWPRSIDGGRAPHRRLKPRRRGNNHGKPRTLREA